MIVYTKAYALGTKLVQAPMLATFLQRAASNACVDLKAGTNDNRRRTELKRMLLTRTEVEPGMQTADRLDMLDRQHKNVLKILAEEESMPFLELSAVTDVDDETLTGIVADLERDGFVEVTGEDILEEIVTVKRRLAALAASAM